MAWKHPSKGTMEFKEVCNFIREKVEGNEHQQFEIFLGTDSQAHAYIDATRYVTALIIHTVGKGATYFIKKEDEQLASSLRQKIWRESIITLEIATYLDEEIPDILMMDNIKFQIHADLGEHGPTKHLIKEVTGMFIAAGYDVVTKPYSIAASATADRFSK